MKKILLTAIVALLGLSAFAAQPDAGTKGYFYNPASGKFIDTNAQLSATEGELFTVKYKNDAEKAANPAADYPDRGFDGGFYIRFSSSKGDLSLQSQPLYNGGGYAQFIVKETEAGWLITHPYPNTSGNVPGWVNDNLDAYQGAYLQVVEGELVFAKDTENGGAYWQFVDEDTYKKIVGPTYPIDLTGDAAKVAVTGNADAATFTPTGTLQNMFQIKPFDVSEFRGYGYKKIVVEFSGANADQFHGHAYGNGNDPHWDVLTGMDNAPEWLAMGDSKFEVALTADVIEDFTVFTWFDGSAGPITITAYFSKEDLGAETPEPTPAAFPEFGAQGFLYNPESGLIVNASATLVSKAAINKETDILTVWQKGTESYSATRVRIATGKTDDVWTSLRVKDGEEGAYTIGFINDGYSRMTLEAGPEEGSYYINNTYNTGGESSHPGYIKANVEDGSLTIATEKDEYCVWKFLTEEEFDALATRISSVEKQPATQAIFNVAGQQIKALQKGLNIVNGKKIMVK